MKNGVPLSLPGAGKKVLLSKISIIRYFIKPPGGSMCRTLSPLTTTPAPHPARAALTLIRMTKDEKGLAFFKGLLLENVLSVKK
jgi:hypothetical protein